MTQTCERCDGNGIIGRSVKGGREAPGPVPEETKNWYEDTCPDCHGMGEILEAGED